MKNTAFAATFFLLNLVTIGTAQAQVSTDGTLSTTVNSSDSRNFVIENGDRAGNNLFHSFRDFSVPTGGSVTFNNAIDVQNVFSRVTGGNPSTIDGLIRANGSANLFLLNPSGILFGANAQLNIGGSFLGTTATSIRFTDGIEFSAVSPPASQLLTVSVPLGLQFGQNPAGQNPAPITVQGTGHRLTANSATPLNLGATPINLRINPGQTLALIAGELNLKGAVLSVASGQIELGSVVNGFVRLSPIATATPAPGWSVTYTDVSSFGNAILNQRSLINTSGDRSGSIQVRGQDITIADGTYVINQNRDQPAGDLTIHATGLLNLLGLGSSTNSINRITSGTLGSSDGGDVNIFARRLQSQDGSEIAARTTGSAKGGDINVTVAESIALTGFSSVNPTAATDILTSTARGTGSAGAINISAAQLNLTEGAVVQSFTSGVGGAGNIQIDVATIELAGINRFTFLPSGINSTTTRAGTAGNVTIETDRLRLRDGALITSSTLATGNAADVIINASESVTVEGFAPGSVLSSSIRSSAIVVDPLLQRTYQTPPIPTGNAGSVRLNARQVNLSDRGEITVKNDGPGEAGNLSIVADGMLLRNEGRVSASTTSGNGGSINLQIQNGLRLMDRSQISASAAGAGNGGQMTMAADTLTLDRSQIITRSTGTGNAGQLRVNADRVQLNHRSLINASTQVGRGGDVLLNVRDRLDLNRRSTITADAQQSGISGNVILRAGVTELNHGSIVSTNALGTARGGRLSLTSDRLNLLDGAQLSASTGGSGRAGSVNIQASDVLISGVGRDRIPSIIGAGTLPSSSGQGGDLTVTSDRIRILDGGLISTGTTGTGTAGDILIQASESIEVTGRSNRGAPSFGYRRNHPSHISASSLTNAPAGSVRIQTPVLTLGNGAIVEVSGAGSGGAGNLEVTADQINLSDRARLEAEVAGGNRGNISLNAGLLSLRNRSQITTNATGTASGGNINLNTDFVIGAENSDIAARAEQGAGGNIAIDTQGLLGIEPRLELTSDSDINASSQLGLNGIVNVTTPSVNPGMGLIELPTEIVDSSQQITAICNQAQDNQFVITGRGGIPASPENHWSSDRPWSDLRDLNLAASEQPATLNSVPPIQEATALQMNGNGQLELVALLPLAPASSSNATCSGGQI